MARRRPRTQRPAPSTARCRTTGKVRYRDATAAGRAQQRLNAQGRHVHPYLCPWCGDWHHTTTRDDSQDDAA